jgi:hypothetical protein
LEQPTEEGSAFLRERSAAVSKDQPQRVGTSRGETVTGFALNFVLGCRTSEKIQKCGKQKQQGRQAEKRERLHMQRMQGKAIGWDPTFTSVAAALVTLVLLHSATARAQGTDNRAPDVPDAIAVPVGNKVHFHTYAEGVQIYTWNGTNWVFKAPEAVLFDADGNIVGTHYAGPTWKSNSGSTVVGARVAGVTVDSTAIPWLLLRATSMSGPGIFKKITYIHRVNTEGGLAPTERGSFAGQEVEVPYTAEYFFYRATR